MIWLGFGPIRRKTPEVSLKIDRALGLEEGTMYLVQAYYAIRAEQLKENIKQRPDLSLFRKALFWDTDMSKLDWEKQHKSIIQRIFERGDSWEKQAILDFYGKDKVNEHIPGTGDGFKDRLLYLTQTYLL